MINLANKCVLVRTWEEYESVLREARRQGYRWYGGVEAYPFKNQQIPDILKFYEHNKEITRNSGLAPEYKLIEASDVIENEKKLKDAVSRVRTFVKNPDRAVLTEVFFESLLLLVNTVEKQLEEVK